MLAPVVAGPHCPVCVAAAGLSIGVNEALSRTTVGVGNNSQIPGRSWDGYLDEARVMNVSKDENWIKLEFESQRAGQKFVAYGAAQQRF